ncbi:MAG TPA: preprotein translocase subunit SecG [Candidatus Hydrogenedens sp.]|nr:preprotein translocase subunit SecG [Candidatus Hydrogenedens sp.]HOK08113.1 preprotein translocase subunit SecG [Candidatus Hydrogenedens sp.]HPP57893.1 preprotein translocase subunit SecG [Candidatus Hydrogenedens sp.]
MLETIFSLTTLWWVLLLFIYLPCCVALIIIVLLQKGKGAGFAGAFGLSPGTESVFGPKLARTLPQKLTYISAGVFMVLAILLSTISGKVGKGPAPELVYNELSTEQNTALDNLFDNKTPSTTTTPVTVENKTNTPPVESAPVSTETDAPQSSTETPTSNQ